MTRATAKHHPTDKLPDYLLGELSPEETREVDAHLAVCGACRAELARLNATIVALTEALPEVEPSATSWAAIEARLQDRTPAPPSRAARTFPVWTSFALAASLLLALVAGGWGLVEQREVWTMRAEQQTVARWLTQPGVVVKALPVVNGKPLGSVLLLPDRRALFVLHDAPPSDKSYQAWGHRNGVVEPMAVSEAKVFEVDVTGFEVVGVSLEPAGGSQQPTQPLGTTSLL